MGALRRLFIGRNNTVVEYWMLMVQLAPCMLCHLSRGGLTGQWSLWSAGLSLDVIAVGRYCSLLPCRDAHG